jgi:CheY-like chemotaxis protein
MLPNRPLVLCVDDDPDDQQLIQDALMALNPGLHVASVSNGEEALCFLQTAKEQNNLPVPVFMDINMPLMDGKQTLANMRNDPDLQGIPVVFFTTSSF